MFAAQACLLAVFFHHGHRDRARQQVRQDLAKLLRTFDATDIRRHHRDRLLTEERGQALGEQWGALQVPARDSVGVVEGAGVVHVQRHNAVHAAAFHQPSHMASDDSVLKLYLAVLATITKVRRDCRHLAGSSVLERATEEQQPA
ncbi:hypothetical protein D3C75_965290 [compost metagenome]